MAVRDATRRYDLLFTALHELGWCWRWRATATSWLPLSARSSRLPAGLARVNGLLLVVWRGRTAALPLVHTVGTLAPEQIGACQRGESVRGVSPH